MVLPACEAVTVQLPAPVMLTLLPETVQLPTAAKVTGSPEAPPVALTLNAASPNVLLSNASNVIVWLALAMLKLWKASSAWL